MKAPSKPRTASALLLWLCLLGQSGCFDVASTSVEPITTLQSPTGGEVWGGSQTIRWQTATSQTVQGTVEIRLSTDGGVFFDTLLAAERADTGSFTWNTTAHDDGSSYLLRILPTDGTGIRGRAAISGSFTIDNTAPTCELSYPSGGETLSATTTIRWSSNDVNPKTVDIYLSTDSGGTYVSTLVTALEDSGSWAWDTSTVPSTGAYRLRVVPTDDAGNVGSPGDSSADFSVDNVPRVTGVARYTDEDGDGTLSKDDRIVVPFDRNVKVNGVGQAAFRLPVSGDDLGTFASVSAGPEAHQVQITLGSSPRLTIRGDHSPSLLLLGSPSGIDLSTAMPVNGIEDADNGTDAQPGTAIDLSPGFVDSDQSLGSWDTRSVALGDVDGDGDLDLATGNDGSASPDPGDPGQGNRIWINQGGAQGGTASLFVDSGQSLGTGPTGAVALGDLDGDGDLDLVSGNDNGRGNRIWINQGGAQAGTEGVFLDSGQSLGTWDTHAVALGDIDGDGDLDLATGNFNGHPNRIWRNDGSAAFSNTDQYLGSVSTEDLVLGDLDGDGDLDLISGNHDTGARVWLNQGGRQGGSEGVFIYTEAPLGTGAIRSVALGDLDGDGDLDLVCAVEGGSNGVYRNDGLGAFTDTAQTLGANASMAVAIGDIDLDGDLDFVSANGASADRIWINDGLMHMTDSAQDLSTGTAADAVMADLDGDGDLDLVVGNRLGQGNVVWRGSATATRP